MRKSPQTIDYKALLAWTRKQLGYALQRQTAAQSRGVTNQEALSHDVACAKTLVRMLDKCEPGRQVNLFEVFQSLKK